MEKILLVINPHRPEIDSIDFACQMASYVQSKLTGLFIENIFSKDEIIIDTDSSTFQSLLKEKARTKVYTDQAVKIFKDQCRERNVQPEIYIDKGEPIQEVIFESRFADLLIVNPSISFYKTDSEVPSHLVKMLLAHAECPILLTPHKYEGVEEIVFCYDGSASSVFAIKQFTFLFPQLNNKNVILLEIQPGNDELMEEHKRMMEWLKIHYNSVHFHVLKDVGSDGLTSYFFMKSKKFIVLGAYGKKMLSKLLNKSHADVLMRIVNLPIFITHH